MAIGFLYNAKAWVLLRTIFSVTVLLFGGVPEIEKYGLVPHQSGEVSEWFKETVLKTVVPAMVP